VEFLIGSNGGTISAPLLVPFILGHYGWRETFCLDWRIGFIMDCFVVEILQYSGKTKKESQEELQYIKSDQAEKRKNSQKFLFRIIKI
jgi:ACS family hexuronate transporter-like MFS transporter